LKTGFRRQWYTKFLVGLIRMIIVGKIITSHIFIYKISLCILKQSHFTSFSIYHNSYLSELKWWGIWYFLRCKSWSASLVFVLPITTNVSTFLIT